MKKNFLLSVLLLLIVLGCNSPKAESRADILGIRLDINQENAHKVLREIGKLEKEERKQQEIWALNNDPHYSHLIVAFTSENPSVRYITAKAREGGSTVRYSDVLDISKARQTGSANNHKYIEEFPAEGNRSAYSTIASGTDADYLTYLSLKVLNSSESEEDEEENETN